MTSVPSAHSPPATVLSLAQLLEQPSPSPLPSLVEPGLLPAQGILFVGGEPKVGKSLLVVNLALALAAGSDRLGFPVPTPRRVLICQFELPLTQFVSRLATMRRALGAAADQNLFVDTRGRRASAQCSPRPESLPLGGPRGCGRDPRFGPALFHPRSG